jgi:hypothetical protein
VPSGPGSFLVTRFTEQVRALVAVEYASYWAKTENLVFRRNNAAAPTAMIAQGLGTGWAFQTIRRMALKLVHTLKLKGHPDQFRKF